MRKAGGEEGKCYQVICAKQAFHGRTFGGMSATPQEKIQKGFRPMTPGFVFGELNNLASFEALIDESTAAIFVETIQGEGGVNPCTSDFLHGLRRRPRGWLWSRTAEQQPQTERVEPLDPGRMPGMRRRADAGLAKSTRHRGHRRADQLLELAIPRLVGVREAGEARRFQARVRVDRIGQQDEHAAGTAAHEAAAQRAAMDRANGHRRGGYQAKVGLGGPEDRRRKVFRCDPPERGAA